MRKLMIIFIILVSLSLNAQRSTFGFYKIGVCKVDAEELYPVTDTSYTLVNGEIRFVGNYVTIDNGKNEDFYNITETSRSGINNTHILWNTHETVVAHWADNGVTLGVISTEPDNKYSNTLTMVTYYLTKHMVYRGNNKYPKKGEVKIKPPSKNKTIKNNSIY